MGFLLSMVASTLSHQLFFSGFGGRSNWLVTPSVREVLAPRLWSLGKMIRHPFGREAMIVHALRAFACNNQTHPQCFTMVHVPRPTNPWSLQWRRSIFGHGLQGVESMTSYRRYVGHCRTKIDIIDQSLPIINYCNLFVKRWSQSEGSSATVPLSCLILRRQHGEACAFWLGGWGWSSEEVDEGDETFCEGRCCRIPIIFDSRQSNEILSNVNI